MIYDYTNDETGEGLDREVKTLTELQKEEVLSFIHDLKLGRGKKGTEQYTQWLKDVVIPMLHEYAKETFSVLEIEEKKEEVHIQLRNNYGYDIGASDGAVKLALLYADYVGIDKANGEIRLDLSYGIG